MQTHEPFIKCSSSVEFLLHIKYTAIYECGRPGQFGLQNSHIRIRACTNTASVPFKVANKERQCYINKQKYQNIINTSGQILLSIVRVWVYFMHIATSSIKSNRISVSHIHIIWKTHNKQPVWLATNHLPRVIYSVMPTDANVGHTAGLWSDHCPGPAIIPPYRAIN